MDFILECMIISIKAGLGTIFWLLSLIALSLVLGIITTLLGK